MRCVFNLVAEVLSSCRLLVLLPILFCVYRERPQKLRLDSLLRSRFLCNHANHAFLSSFVEKRLRAPCRFWFSELAAKVQSRNVESLALRLRASSYCACPMNHVPFKTCPVNFIICVRLPDSPKHCTSLSYPLPNILHRSANNTKLRSPG